MTLWPVNTISGTTRTRISTLLCPGSSNKWDPKIDSPNLNPMEDPVSTFHHINAKINDPEQANDDYPVLEMAYDIARLLLAAQSLIQMNGRMAERILKAEKSAEDAQVALLSKDMENYELFQKLNYLKENP
jgi:hypothetical protein